ncbi:hypothetical protein DFH28DRAFT_1139801 [Melampsora americana]|nr:hypothetical protein DFH28DRAFT_1139801 [Melampsora americana]
MAFIAHYGEIGSPVDGRAWQPPASLSSIHPNSQHPTHNRSESFCTIGEIQDYGSGVLNNGNNWVPQGPTVPSVYPSLPPTRMAEVISCAETGTVSPLPRIGGFNLGSTLTSRFSEPLGSLSNGDIANRTLISSLDQCPVFWQLSLGQLYEWECRVVIKDESVRIHFNNALKDAELHINQASSEGLTIDPPVQPPGQNGCAPHAIRENVPPNGLPKVPKFQFNKLSPDHLDLMFMRSLEELSPFGTVGQKGKIFQQCAVCLKTEEGTCNYFHALPSHENSQVLQSQYTQLKIWLAAAEGWSKMATGTKEDDAELRRLIEAVEHEETVRVIILLTFVELVIIVLKRRLSGQSHYIINLCRTCDYRAEAQAISSIFQGS